LRVTFFDAPISLTLSYLDTDVGDFKESELKIHRYNTTTSLWEALSNCSVDTGANTVTCETSNFSTFGIFGDEEGGSSSSSG
jgi:hypothetical protein